MMGRINNGVIAGRYYCICGNNSQDQKKSIFFIEPKLFAVLSSNSSYPLPGISFLMTKLEFCVKFKIRAQEVTKNFLDCGGQGCCIIPD